MQEFKQFAICFHSVHLHSCYDRQREYVKLQYRAKQSRSIFRKAKPNPTLRCQSRKECIIKGRLSAPDSTFLISRLHARRTDLALLVFCKCTDALQRLRKHLDQPFHR